VLQAQKTSVEKRAGTPYGTESCLPDCQLLCGKMAGSDLSPLVSAAGGKRLRELAVGFELPCGIGPEGSVGNRSLQIRRSAMDSNKPAQNIQDSFLNTARKERMSITIYLLSGVKLTGRIRSFDKYSVVLEANGQEQLIFKHAISTIVMGRTVAHGAHLAHTEAKPSAGTAAPTAVSAASASGTEG
jgi:host factor-I protein